MVDFREEHGVTEAALSNGLRVLLKEDHSAPIASVWTWYRVGSRNEVPGKTGLSHWVEHMQFKGTPTIAKGQIFRDVSRAGGTLNALTSQDWTAYFETLPESRLDLSLAIESDRMSNSLFDPEEVASERTVILSERQGSENNPAYALYEEVTGTAFQAHPYRHMVIGYTSDLRHIARDDLYQHYRRHYQPVNAFVVAVGDFSSGDLLERLETRFGGIPAGKAIARDIGVKEPVQPGVRRVQIRKPSGVPYLRMAFHAPPASDKDLVPLLVAEAVLSGGQPMGFGAGGSMGRSSRLYRALVASGLARGAGSDMSVSLDPYLFQIGVTGLPDSDLSAVEAVIDNELLRLRDEAVPAEELARAIKQLEAQFVYSSEGVTNQAYWLGQWEVVDTWRRAASFPDEVRAVTVEAVQEVAQRYFDLDRRTVGWLVPTGDEGGASDLADTAAATLSPLVWGLNGLQRGSQEVAEGFQRAQLSNGVPVLIQERPSSRSAVLRMRLNAGSIWGPAPESGIAHLTARAALRGSAGKSFDEIASLTDSLGSSLSLDSGRQFAEARVRSLTDDLPKMIELLAETLRQPDFPESEVAKVRQEQLGAISEAENDTRAMADALLRHGVYPAPNPLGQRVLGSRESVSAFSAGTAREFHERAYRPTGAAIALVGGFDSVDRVLDQLEAAFGDWSPVSDEATPPDTSHTNREPDRDVAALPGKSQADLAMGAATIARGHSDYYALDIANLILGRLGLMGRLGAEVRDRQGLAYYVFSQLEARTDGTLWSARAGVDPSNIDQALDAIRGELDRLRAERVTEKELRDAQSYLIGVLPLALESHDGVAATLLAIEEFDLGLDYLERYPAIISAVTREDVLRAAAAHLDPARLAIGIACPA